MATSTPVRSQSDGILRTPNVNNKTLSPVAFVRSPSSPSHLHPQSQPQSPSRSSNEDGASSRSRPKIILDDAFSIAKKLQCTTFKFLPVEIDLILEALGYSRYTAESSDSGGQSESLVELPLLNSAPLASVLTSFIRSRVAPGSNLNRAVVTQDKADIAVNNINGLIEGQWRTFLRSFILQATNTAVSPVSAFALRGHGRPSNWPPLVIRHFVNYLQLPMTAFMDCTGPTFLAIEPHQLFDDYEIRPSILQARFLVYQQVLRLIELWWDRGCRPQDPIMSPHSPLTTIPSLLQPAVPVLVEEDNSKGWGVIKKDAKSGLKRGFVEIAPTEVLLGSWASLSRAYGWNTPIDTMTIICGRIGGLVGRLLPPAPVTTHSNPNDDSKSIGCRLTKSTSLPSGNKLSLSLASIPSTNDFPKVKGAQWVLIIADSSTHPTDLNMCLKPFCDNSCPFVRAMTTAEETIPATEYASSIDCAVLVPQSCLRRAKAKTVHRNLANESLESITVGMTVHIVDFKNLLTACSKFEWWDRPAPKVLERMAGKRGEIIATNELQSKRRVGVKVTGPPLLCDALPVEALLLARKSRSDSPPKYTNKSTTNTQDLQSGAALRALLDTRDYSWIRFQKRNDILTEIHSRVRDDADGWENQMSPPYSAVRLAKLAERPHFHVNSATLDPDFTAAAWETEGEDEESQPSPTYETVLSNGHRPKSASAALGDVSLKPLPKHEVGPLGAGLLSYQLPATQFPSPTRRTSQDKPKAKVATSNVATKVWDESELGIGGAAVKR